MVKRERESPDPLEIERKRERHGDDTRDRHKFKKTGGTVAGAINGERPEIFMGELGHESAIKSC